MSEGAAGPNAGSSEMEIPKSRSDIVLLGLDAIVIFSVAVAVFNLINSSALILSIIWLLYVAMMIKWGCEDAGGVRKFMINHIGKLARRQFAKSVRQDAQPAEIRFGYRLLGCRFYYLKVRSDRIMSVEWSSGQATDKVGRDMNDWSVCLWFEADTPTAKRGSSPQGKGNLFLVGPQRPKQVTEVFGLSFVAFLRDAGVILIRNSEGKFVRSEPQNGQSEG